MSDHDTNEYDNVRPLEDSVVTNLSAQMSYGGYLRLHELLDQQRPRSRPVHHDELLFIIQHQTTELWLKLALHELLAARDWLAADDLAPALKSIARVKHIVASMTEQWSVLATLTPTEYNQFRGALGNASGLQSYQYRAVEFVLGNKNARMLSIFDADPPARQLLQTVLTQPSLYDAFLGFLQRTGHRIPSEVLDRPVELAHTFSPGLLAVFTEVYDDPQQHWSVYETCEELVDLEDCVQLWRFRHLRTVQRVIGMKSGTGGSSGVPFLRRALDLTFFPELFAVRTQIGVHP